MRRKRGFTLLLEVVVALEAAAETINGLAGLTNPESDGVYGFSKGSHLASVSIGLKSRLVFGAFDQG